MYDFHKLKSKNNMTEFSHPHFKRDNKKALINIERKDKLKSYNSENFTYNHMLSKRSHSSDDDCIHNSCEQYLIEIKKKHQQLMNQTQTLISQNNILNKQNQQLLQELNFIRKSQQNLQTTDEDGKTYPSYAKSWLSSDFRNFSEQSCSEKSQNSKLMPYFNEDIYSMSEKSIDYNIDNQISIDQLFKDMVDKNQDIQEDKFQKLPDYYTQLMD